MNKWKRRGEHWTQTSAFEIGAWIIAGLVIAIPVYLLLGGRFW